MCFYIFIYSPIYNVHIGTSSVAVCDMCMCLARGGVGGEGGECMR